MISIKRSITFKPEANKAGNLSKGKDKSETVRLRCSVTWDSKRVRLSTGFNVNPSPGHWEESLQRCKAKSCHGLYKTPASVINRAIDQQEELINHIFHTFEEQDTIPSKEEFLKAYNTLAKPDETTSEEVPVADKPLFPIYDEFMSDNSALGKWTYATRQKYRTIKNHLHSISPDLSLNDIVKGGNRLLIDYFSKIKDNLKQTGLANNTIKRDIVLIRTFMKWASLKGYCNAEKFLSQPLRLKTPDNPIIYLTWEELMKIYHWDFNDKPNLDAVRDVFCFCCFTSLRYSDVWNLKKANIRENDIVLTTIKTNDNIIIELNKYSKAILRKYKDTEFPDGKALPVISNQKMNDALKTIGKTCGLDSEIIITRHKGATRTDHVYKKWELLSTHAGRRTFISNAIMLGIPANIVMKWTGHKNYATMKKYLSIADNVKANAMSVFNKIEDHIDIARNIESQKAENPPPRNPQTGVGQKVGQKSDFP